MLKTSWLRSPYDVIGDRGRSLWLFKLLSARSAAGGIFLLKKTEIPSLLLAVRQTWSCRPHLFPFRVEDVLVARLQCLEAENACDGVGVSNVNGSVGRLT